MNIDVLKDIRGLKNKSSVSVEIREDDRFLCTPKEFADWAGNRKQLRMEYFYREMRKKHDVLMTGNKPIGGKCEL